MFRIIQNSSKWFKKAEKEFIFSNYASEILTLFNLTHLCTNFVLVWLWCLPLSNFNTHTKWFWLVSYALGLSIFTPHRFWQSINQKYQNKKKGNGFDNKWHAWGWCLYNCHTRLKLGLWIQAVLWWEPERVIKSVLTNQPTHPAPGFVLSMCGTPSWACLYYLFVLNLKVTFYSCSACSRSQVQNQSFGPKQNTKLTVDPPTCRKLFAGF